LESVWHYQDDLSQYYLSLQQRGSQNQWLALVDGHAIISSLRAVAGAGLERLYSPDIQSLTDEGQIFYGDEYRPNRPTLLPGSVVEQGVSFNPHVPYAIYNWELFFHAPLLIADYLSKQQRFEDAQRWLHFIFDPLTDEPGADAARFWRFRQFREAGKGEPIEQLLEWLANPHEDTPQEAAFRDQIVTWKKDPFRPHAIARMRVRAYQWRTLFTYLDNLIAWGAQLFQRDTRESINEATLLYVLAANILGPRPIATPSRREAPPLTYQTFAGRWHEFANAWYAFADNPLVQAWLEFLEWLKEHGVVGPQVGDDQTQLLASLGMLAFCVPHNEKLVEYWNIVEDRLFKIRHCRNIEGVARDLPLFEPPIDPELLVRATAAGVDIESVLADRAASPPHYRFQVLLQKASEICGELNRQIQKSMPSSAADKARKSATSTTSTC
jgi:hypothetical protein